MMSLPIAAFVSIAVRGLTGNSTPFVPGISKLVAAFEKTDKYPLVSWSNYVMDAEVNLVRS